MMMKHLYRIALVAILFAPAGSADESITILPNKIELTGKDASHRFLVQRLAQGRIGKEITSQVKLQLRSDGIAKIQDGMLIALSEGQTQLIATDEAGNRAEALVIVRLAKVDRPVRFVADVQSIMAKVGCNGGACHGALAGKGGFRLSLRGYDPDGDFFNITRQARGRRIELADPTRSLLIAKPSGVIPHKGGLRLPESSANYKTLLKWIQSGAPGPSAEDPVLQRVEVLPSDVKLAKGDQQRLIVRAHYSDGHVRDVTDWVKWSSTNDATARVDEGNVNVTGPGVGAITAWFASRVVLAKVRVPFEYEVSESMYDELSPRSFIDEMIVRQLRQLQLAPSPRASDSEFLRRSFLDTIGRLPSIEETRSFLSNEDSDKRDHLIESLLSRPEFVDYWAYKWSDILLVNGTKLRPEAIKSFYFWIRGHVQENTAWDEFVRRIVTARGNSLKNGATNFFAIHQSPEDMTENASQAFLGLSIACAKCHNHPLEKWTNDQYYAMANLFARVRAKGWGGDSRNGDGNRTIVVLDRGDLIQPLTGKPQPPAPLDTEALSFDDPGDRREYFAQWLTSPENPYFSRSIANRIWANFFGIGLVESVDDMRVSNPATNEELLGALAQHLADNDFDVKSLMRVILQSETYQRTSQSIPQNVSDLRFYSRYYPRRLMAEVLLDAVADVTDQATTFDNIAFPGADKQKTEFYPAGTRAIQLYDSAVDSYFLKTFGRNPRDITCECERSNEPSVIQVLHLSNGNTVNQKLASKSGVISRWIGDELDDRTIIERAYLRALCRYPTQQESDRLLALLADQSDRREAVEDLVWGILSTREFLFTH